MLQLLTEVSEPLNPGIVVCVQLVVECNGA